RGVQPVRRLPGFPGPLRALPERLPAPAAAARGPPGPGRRGGGRRRRRGGGGRGPGPPPPLVPPLLRHHPRVVPDSRPGSLSPPPRSDHNPALSASIASSAPARVVRDHGNVAVLTPSRHIPMITSGSALSDLLGPAPTTTSP